nr:glycine betaine ABC transporter substrate-binding protein [Ectobacillus ponti]
MLQTKQASRISKREEPLITLGAKSITEQYILMKMTAILLREQGFQTREIVFLDSPAIRSAMENGKVDLYWEYTGTAHMFYHQEPALYDGDAMFAAVAKKDKEKQIEWIGKSSFNSTWVVLMKQSIADAQHIRTLTDLSSYAKQHSIKVAANEEFLNRADGIQHIQAVYNLPIQPGNLVVFDSELLYQAVNEQTADVAIGMAGDSRLKEYGLQVLEDDKQAFPPYHAAPVVRKEVKEAHPQLASVMQNIIPYITNETIIDLTYQVDILHRDVMDVAKQFLEKHNLIRTRDAS